MQTKGELQNESKILNNEEALQRIPVDNSTWNVTRSPTDPNDNDDPSVTEHNRNTIVNVDPNQNGLTRSMNGESRSKNFHFKINEIELKDLLKDLLVSFEESNTSAPIEISSTSFRDDVALTNVIMDFVEKYY